MKQTALLFFTITLFLNQEACRSRQQADSQPAGSTTTTGAAATPETSANITITGRLADLGLTPDSHWRGINLGDAFSNVNATEKGEPFENDATHVGYTVELKNLETADMLYYQTGQKVSAIDVDLFLNSRPSVDAYQTELSGYFMARYGAAKPGNGGTVWTGQKGEKVALRDVSKGKDFGLKIKISAAGTTTASAR